MTSPSLVRRLAGSILAAAVSVSGQELVFTHRLATPVAGDTIAFPQAVTADPATGEVFVCDSRANRVLIFDAEGTFLFQFPGGEQFSAPMDLAVDPDGFLLLVANRDRRRTLLELDFDGLFRREVVLDSGDEPPPRTLDSVALSADGRTVYLLDGVGPRLYVADREGVVRRSVDLAAAVQTPERKDLIFTRVDVSGDRVLVPVPTLGQVLIFTLDGELERPTGLRGTAPCQLAFPTAAAMDEAGELLVIDQQRMIILRWDARKNRCLDEYYSIGDRPGYFYFPHDLALDRRGRAYVAQGFEGRVQVFEGGRPVAGIGAEP